MRRLARCRGRAGRRRIERALSAATLSRALGGAFMLVVALIIVRCHDRFLDAIGARSKKGDESVGEVVPLLGVDAAAGFF